MKTSGILFGIALVSAPAVASASLIGIQFQGGGTALSASQTAGVIPQANFNVASGASGTALPLNYSDSTADTAPETLTFSTDDQYGTGAGTSDGNHTLLSGKVGTGVGTATFTLNNVPDGTYNVVVYAVNDTTGHYPEITMGSTSYIFQSQGGPSFNGTFIPTTNTTAGTYPVANYVEFTNVSPTAGQLVLTVTNATGYYSDINGLQLQSVPEPASIASISLFSLGLLRRRR